MKIALGSDHAGYELKEMVRQYLENDGIEVIDCGTYSEESVDYPDIAEKVGEMVLQDHIFAILICGTGIGIAIAANKIPGIRAAVCRDVDTARLAREHNDANVLAIGARVTPGELVLEMIKTFIKTDFQAGRHLQRVEKINRLEKKCRERS